MWANKQEYDARKNVSGLCETLNPEPLELLEQAAVVNMSKTNLGAWDTKIEGPKYTGIHTLET